MEGLRSASAADQVAIEPFNRVAYIPACSGTQETFEDPQLKRRLVDGVLGVVLADNVKARQLQADGTYRRTPPAQSGEPSIRSQLEFQNMALELCETSPISRPAATALGNV